MDRKEDISSVTGRLKMMCSRREYSVSDVMKKALSALHADKELASKVVGELVAEGYVDDFRYASAYARDKSSIAGWGSAKIRYMLAAKGVARDVIDRALGEVDESKADARMENLLRNKCRTLKNDPQVKVKLLRFAVGRGYSYEESSRIINMLIEDNEEY